VRPLSGAPARGGELGITGDRPATARQGRRARHQVAELLAGERGALGGPQQVSGLARPARRLARGLVLAIRQRLVDRVDRDQQALQRRVQAFARVDAGYASGCGLATEALVAVITALFDAHGRIGLRPARRPQRAVPPAPRAPGRSVLTAPEA
jgi:hypothetical protein